MNYYKTGELAKKANVTIRTIRYYDSIDLLKPGRIDDNGYRYYDDNDYFKLQKILCLKSLGFDLNDIKTMTATNNYTSLQDAIHFQLLSIDKQINNLKLLKENLKDIGDSIDKDNSIDWSNIVREMQLNNLNQDILEQYKNSTNIDIRIKLHKLYSHNKLTWFRWLYSFYNLKANTKVLELGCGNGSLWLENIDRIKGDITLSDISSGMVLDAKNNCKQDFNYEVFDAHSIPYKDNSFDVVICNHFLFYAKDIDKVLSEISRVLKKNGKLYCTTYGKDHMKENTELVKEYNPKISLSNINLYEVFGLENGEKILSKYFKDIKLEKYEDYLEVSNPDDLLNYILSCHGNQNEYLSDHLNSFKKLMMKKFKNGYFHITKDSGLFICKNNK